MSFLILFAFWGTITGLLAKRKNRDPWGWGIAGGLIPLLTLLVLAFMPWICPRCHQPISAADSKAGRCPGCKGSSLV